MTIGAGKRSVTVGTLARSDTILSANSCSGIINCSGNGANNGLANGLNQKTVEVLMAQTLSITYNINLVSGYLADTISSQNCVAYLTPAPAGLELSPNATVVQTQAAANALIGGSIKGGATTQGQASAMNNLLSCLNRETP